MPMQKTEEPLVSILMNCFNGEKYVNGAIDSVLNQTYQNWEIIFWDNMSTDKTAVIVKIYDDNRIKYYDNAKGKGEIKLFINIGGGIYAVGDSIERSLAWLPLRKNNKIKDFKWASIGRQEAWD